MSEWQQIHAQIDAIVRAIPEHFLLDPPDGGDVTVAEGVQRMAARIEQLEAALRRWEQYGCTDCGGDCASANPPVSCCIMQETRAALKETK